jgi:hypothetical protein
MSKHSFDEAKAVLMARHQQAIAAAQQEHSRRVAELETHHRERREAAEVQWESLKNQWDHPDHADANRRFEEACKPVDCERARRVMADAIILADAEYQAELDKIANQHGIVIRRFA